MTPRRVLFLSTGNAARSQIAEALLNARQSERFIARSAGFEPLARLPQETKALLEREGLSAQRLHPKGWSLFLASNSLLPIDVIVTLSVEARALCPPWPGDPVRVHWTLDDPLSAFRPDVREWKYRKCFATLAARIDTLLRIPLATSQGELLLQLKAVGMVV